jgi:NADH dehydrogenase/NADH:ubiquinone oxidoreductase subunit G
MSDTVVPISSEQLQKELEALKRENRAAMQTIQKLLKELNGKNEEIKNLQSIVNKAVPVVRVPDEKKSGVIMHTTAEEEIALEQLQRLRAIARERQLTLEETKIYDILVKNKRLTQDESTVNLSKAQYRDISAADLLQLASGPNVKDSSDNG